MASLWLRLIAALEILGGMFGIGLALWQVFSLPSSLPYYSLPFVFLIYTFSLVAGIELWRGRRRGHIASVVVQSIQLVKIFSTPITFAFSFGLDVYLNWLQADGLSDLSINFRFLAFHQFFINMPDVPTGLGVSVLALLFLTILILYKPNMSIEKGGQANRLNDFPDL